MSKELIIVLVVGFKNILNFYFSSDCARHARKHQPLLENLQVYVAYDCTGKQNLPIVTDKVKTIFADIARNMSSNIIQRGKYRVCVVLSMSHSSRNVGTTH